MSVLVFAGLVIIALATFTDAVGKLVTQVKGLFSGNSITHTESLDQWASRVASRSNISSPSDQVLLPLSDADQKGVYAYQSFIGSLQKSLDALRSSDKRNIYVDLPDFPTNAALANVTYAGQVTFSRNAAWSMLCQRTEQPGYSGPLLGLHYMNGDGHVKGGSGVGAFSIQYQFEDDTVKLNASGVAAPMLRRFQQSYSRDSFAHVAPELAKVLLEIEMVFESPPH